MTVTTEGSSRTGEATEAASAASAAAVERSADVEHHVEIADSAAWVQS